jgi:hypothetical protein
VIPSRPDLLGQHADMRERLRAVEVGARRIRALPGDVTTTPWFALDKATGWTGDAFWRIAAEVVQLRGTLTGPAGWADLATAATLPVDVLPAVTLLLVAVAGDNRAIPVEVTSAGLLRPRRAGQTGDVVRLDPVVWPRG